MAGIKKTKLQQLAIEKLIYELLIAGWTNQHIVDKLIEEEGYKYDNAWKQIVKVTKALKPKVAEEVEDIKLRYIDMYLDIYSRAVDSMDLKAANAILANLTKLQGLAVDKQEIKVEATYQIEF